ncbi:MAG: succinylglutamate desuccinylase, partial [Hyphomicrobiales bacterium]
PPNLSCVAAPFEATDIVASPAAGIVAFKQELVAEVSAGDLIAEVVDVSSNDAQTCRTPVHANTSGRLFTRCLTKIVRPGTVIAKIQGTEPMASRTGYLLTD